MLNKLFMLRFQKKILTQAARKMLNLKKGIFAMMFLRLKKTFRDK